MRSATFAFRLPFAILAAAFVAFGCAAMPVPTDSGRCTPGQQIACACPGGATGIQTCDPSGSGFGACVACGDGGIGDAASDPLVGTWEGTTLTGQDMMNGQTQINVMLTLGADMTFTDSIVAQYGPSADPARRGCSLSLQARGRWIHDAATLTLIPMSGLLTQAVSGCADPANNEPPAMRAWGDQPTYTYALGPTVLTLTHIGGANDFLNRTFTRR